MEALPKFLLFNASSDSSTGSSSHTSDNTYPDADNGSGAGSESDIDFHADLPTVSSHDAVAMLSWLSILLRLMLCEYWLLVFVCNRSNQPCSLQAALINRLIY